MSDAGREAARKARGMAGVAREIAEQKCKLCGQCPCGAMPDGSMGDCPGHHDQSGGCAEHDGVPHRWEWYADDDGGRS